MRKIRDAVGVGKLGEQFKPTEVNNVIGITYAGVFLPKHRVGNPGFKGEKFSEHFIQLERGLYRLKETSTHI
jgi:hypothetical protein